MTGIEPVLVSSSDAGGRSSDRERTGGSGRGDGGSGANGTPKAGGSGVVGPPNVIGESNDVSYLVT
ncbi:MAG: hypothetical protein QG622_386 [Actinomycetota bacterium]|nr:hypothetical protein [Actinomycetota bacterium]